MTEFSHTPVLLEETLNLLGPRGKDELMIDGNTGEGGHSYNFLSKFKELKMVCIDADKDILAIAEERLKEFKDRVYFITAGLMTFLPIIRPNLKGRTQYFLILA